MKQKTRFAFNAYLQQLARLNGVAVTELAGSSVAASPTR